MIQLRPWKIALVLVALLFGFLFTLPNLVPAGTLPGFLPNQRLNLGLDLQGGSYLLYEVDTDALKTELMTNLVEETRTTLQSSQTLFTGLGQVNGGVSVRISDPARLDAAFQALSKLASPIPGTATPDLTFTRGPDQTIQITQSPQAAQAAASKAVVQTIEIIRPPDRRPRHPRALHHPAGHHPYRHRGGGPERSREAESHHRPDRQADLPDGG